MISLVVALLMAGPVAQTCTVQGSVVLKNDGKPVELGEDNVVVYVDGFRDVQYQPKTYQVVQKNKQFHPQLLVLHKQDTVEFINLDKIEHDVFSAAKEGAFYSAGTLERVTTRRDMKVAGTMRVGCKLHKIMRADLLVLEHRMFAIVRPDGTFTLKNAPAGRKLKLVAWERNGGKTTVDVDACTEQAQVPPIALDEAPPPLEGTDTAY